MDLELQTASTKVLDGRGASSIVTVETSHPTERVLGRFASNEMGTQGKKMIGRHLETCHECRQAVTRLHDIARRYRDLERRAIAHVAREVGR